MNYNMSEEKWKDIKQLEGRYMISSKGKVWSVYSNRCLNVRLDSYGYPGIVLRLGGNGSKQLTRPIHRLVAEAFIPNPNKYPCVNHKDEDKTNNHIENLEWCTWRYNVTYGTRIERVKRSTDYNEIAKKISRPIIQRDKEGKFINKWDSIAACAKQLGFDNSSLSKCCKGKIKTAYGYKWEYANK